MAGTNWDFEFHPVGLDKGRDLPAGTRVRLTPTAEGGTRSQSLAHISHPDGTPIGVVSKRSLQRVTSRNPRGNPEPEATDRITGVYRDRRFGA